MRIWRRSRKWVVGRDGLSKIRAMLVAQYWAGDAMDNTALVQIDNGGSGGIGVGICEAKMAA